MVKLFLCFWYFMESFQSNCQIKLVCLKPEAQCKPYHIDLQWLEMPQPNLTPRTSLSYEELMSIFDHCSNIISCYHQAQYSLTRSITHQLVHQTWSNVFKLIGPWHIIWQCRREYHLTIHVCFHCNHHKVDWEF